MTGRAEDRRGDRRLDAPPTCNAARDPGRGADGTPQRALSSELATGDVSRRRCGGELVEALQEAGVVVYCKRCGAVDRRSTEGNRRRAELELGALCRRIERELETGLAELHDRVGELEERVDRRLETQSHRINEVDRRVEDATSTADEAKREAARALDSAERAGRGW